MAKKNKHLLPEKDLAGLKAKVSKHIKSLNKAGITTDQPEKLSADTLKQVLGIKETNGLVEQWLCGADGNCGVKTAKRAMME